MKKTLLVLILTLSFVTFTNAQITIEHNPEHKIMGNDIEPFCNHLKGASIQAMNGSFADIPKRPYDVIHYDLFMDWVAPLSSTLELPVAQYSGTNKITIVITDDSEDLLEFDSELSVIDGVRLGGEIVPFEHFEHSVVKIDMPANAVTGDTLLVEIDYTYKGSGSSGIYVAIKGDFVGVVNYTEDEEPKVDSVFIEENVVYTMSEPENARKWMPCNDAPYDKALSTISVLVPEGFNVACNGLLDDVIEQDGNTLYVWENQEPITTYLMVANASKFKVWSEWYHKVSNPQDSVEVQYYAWEKDYTTEKTAGANYNALKTYKRVIPMMEYFSSTFTEYPFVKYGHVSVQPFNFGGMEHQTLTTVNRAWLRRNSDAGIAHELAHQWMGDLITCATWNDIWINEGGATWSEALWTGENWYPEAYYLVMEGKKGQYLNTPAVHTTPIYGIPADQLFGGTSYFLVYVKSGWVYHMMKETLGDDIFFPALRSVFNKHAYSSLTTEDFIESMKEFVTETPVDLDTFFEQWMFKPGHPVYEIGPRINKNDDNQYDVEITVKQIQDMPGAVETFIMPMTFVFTKDEEIVQTETVLNDQKEQIYNFTLDYKPDLVYLDETKILCRVTIDPSSVDDDIVSELRLMPNPVINSDPAHLEITLDKAERVSIELTDLNGRSIYKQDNELLSAGLNRISFDTADLQSGLYMINIRSKNMNRTVKLSVIK